MSPNSMTIASDSKMYKCQYKISDQLSPILKDRLNSIFLSPCFRYLVFLYTLFPRVKKYLN